MNSPPSQKQTGILWICIPCGRSFVFCLRCDRGHKYCGPGCSQAARRVSRRVNQARYLQTDHGKMKNREHQKAYRASQRKLSVSDQSSPPLVTPVEPSLAMPALVPAASTNISEDVPNESQIEVQPKIIQVPASPMQCRGCGCSVTYLLSEDGVQTVRRKRRQKWLMQKFKRRSNGCSTSIT